MKVIRCLVIDDSEGDAAMLGHQLNRLILAEITYCYTYEDALIRLRASSLYDLVFMDLRIKNKSGMDLLAAFPKLPPVIVMTSYAGYAHLTYDTDAVVDYVLKPSTDNRLLRALNRAFLDIQYFEGNVQELSFIYLKIGRKIMRFNYEKIDHIEAYGTYSKVFSNGSIQLVNESISTLETILPKKIFIRVHKSHIVNIQKITGFDHKHFFLDEISVPIGISYKPQLESFFRLFSY